MFPALLGVVASSILTARVAGSIFPDLLGDVACSILTARVAGSFFLDLLGAVLFLGLLELRRDRLHVIFVDVDRQGVFEVGSVIRRVVLLLRPETGMLLLLLVRG